MKNEKNSNDENSDYEYKDGIYKDGTDENNAGNNVENATIINANDEDIDIDNGEDPVSQLPLSMILEGVIMSASEPATAKELSQILDEDEETITHTLETLASSYALKHRGFRLRQSVRGWSFVCAPELGNIVSRFLKKGTTSKLSQAALEVLAIIAYKQPITRAGISSIRGVSSDSLVRTLLLQGLIEEIVIENSLAHALVTTDLFLEKMDISSLAQLEPLAPLLPEVEEIDLLDKQIDEKQNKQTQRKWLDVDDVDDMDDAMDGAMDDLADDVRDDDIE